MAAAIRNGFPGDFKQVAITRETDAVLAVSNRKISASGLWAESAFPSMLTLKMVKRSYNHFADPSSILISESLALSLFGHADPLNRNIRIDNETDLKVIGVFMDLPSNSRFNGTDFILAWDNKYNAGNRNNDDWLDHHFQVFVQLNDASAFSSVSAKIKDLTKTHIPGAWEELMIHPMDRWHLYTNFNLPARLPMLEMRC